MGFLSGFGKSFGDSVQNNVEQYVKQREAEEKITREDAKIKREAAKEKLEAATANEAAIALAEESGDPQAVESARAVIAAIGDKSASASKSVLSTLEARIKDRTDFKQSMQVEGFKARMSFIPEITKAMAASGDFSPEQIQQFAGMASENAQRGIDKRILEGVGQQQNSAQPQPQGDSQDVSSAFSEPLPKKKSVKQQEREESKEKGVKLIRGAKERFRVIAEKYGVGRIKGLKTGARGMLGDLLPEEERAPEVAAYNGMVDGLAVYVGRNVYEDDRVSKDDREAYKNGIAKLSNTEGEADLMFNILEEFALSGDPLLQTVIKSALPRKGKAVIPSKALKAAGLNPLKFMTLEQKKAELKRRRENGGS